MNANFEILNKFKGFGNPNGAYWFVGIEESLNFKDNLANIIEAYSDEFIPFLENSIINDSQENGRHYTQVYDIMAKILVDITGNNMYWKDFRDKKLLQIDSNEFQMNLFPLGKKKIEAWPDFYQSYFGFNSHKEYLYYVKQTRFKILNDFYKSKKPILTICFGKTHREYFINAFGLKNGIMHGCDIEYYPKEKVIITPFFNNIYMNTVLIKRTVELAKLI